MCKTIGQGFGGKKERLGVIGTKIDRVGTKENERPNQKESAKMGPKRKKKKNDIEKIRPNTQRHTHENQCFSLASVRTHHLKPNKNPTQKKGKEIIKVFLYLHSSNLSLGSNKAPSILSIETLFTLSRVLSTRN